jgi:hypothetical protein
MPGKPTRAKGRRGQTEALNLLRERDWIVADLSAGVDSEDGLAMDPDGNWHALEVKNCASIIPAHRRQAMEQAKRRRLPWMLMSKLDGRGEWLVQRQGKPSVVWRNRTEEATDATSE